MGLTATALRQWSRTTIVHRECSRARLHAKWTILQTIKTALKLKNSLYKVIRKGRSRAKTLKAQTRLAGQWSISEFCQRITTWLLAWVSKSRGSEKARLPIPQSHSHSHLIHWLLLNVQRLITKFEKKGNNLFGVVRFGESKLPASL